MKSLHCNYCLVHERISYSSFCKLRPYWVVHPSARDRETCLCARHANIQLAVSRLNQLKIITQSKADDIAHTIVCDINNKDCMLRKCKSCCDQKLQAVVSDERQGDSVTYYQWRSRSEVRRIKNIEKTVKLTEKAAVHTTMEGLVNVVHDLTQSFLEHMFAVRTQYHTMKLKKEKLLPNEMIIRCDFSENYILKYGEEIQQIHFGASQKQISLHTVVVYHAECYDSMKTTSICTVTDELEH